MYGVEAWAEYQVASFAVLSAGMTVHGREPETQARQHRSGRRRQQHAAQRSRPRMDAAFALRSAARTCSSIYSSGGSGRCPRRWCRRIRSSKRGSAWLPTEATRSVARGAQPAARQPRRIRRRSLAQRVRAQFLRTGAMEFLKRLRVCVGSRRCCSRRPVSGRRPANTRSKPYSSTTFRASWNGRRPPSPGQMRRLSSASSGTILSVPNSTKIVRGETAAGRPLVVAARADRGGSGGVPDPVHSPVRGQADLRKWSTRSITTARSR